MGDKNGQQFRYGMRVMVPWGIDWVEGTVHDIYGSKVVVMLAPEISGSVVANDTTVTFPASEVRPVIR